MLASQEGPLLHGVNLLPFPVSAHVRHSVFFDTFSLLKFLCAVKKGRKFEQFWPHTCRFILTPLNKRLLNKFYVPFNSGNTENIRIIFLINEGQCIVNELSLFNCTCFTLSLLDIQNLILLWLTYPLLLNALNLLFN